MISGRKEQAKGPKPYSWWWIYIRKKYQNHKEKNENIFVDDQALIADSENNLPVPHLNLK